MVSPILGHWGNQKKGVPFDRRREENMKLLLVPWMAATLIVPQDTSPQRQSGSVLGRVKCDGDPPPSRFYGPEETDTRGIPVEDLVVNKEGWVANVVAFLDVAGAPAWKCEKTEIRLSEHRLRPHVVFVSPGGTVEVRNEHGFRQYFQMRSSVKQERAGGIGWRDKPGESVSLCFQKAGRYRFDLC